MNITAQISKQLQEVHFGKNWTWSNLRENLEDVDLKQATTRVYMTLTRSQLWSIT